ncbi:NAD(P)-dependent oxidoreductase [Yimella radicis]
MTRTAIVTGASGFIGTHLVRALVGEGWSVIAVKRPTAQIATELVGRVRQVSAELSDYGDLDSVVGPAPEGVLFHLAWDGLMGAAFKDHTGQLLNAARSVDAVAAAARMGCRRFVMVGSMNEYEILGLGEKVGVAPRWANTYAASKLAAEHIGKTVAHHQGIEFVTARLAMAYGPGNYSMMLPNVVLSQLLSGKTPQLVAGDGPYDLVYSDEIVGALLALAERGVDQRHYYVGHEKTRTFRELITEIRDIVAPGADLNFGAYPEDNAIDYSLIDREALRADTGYSCSADFRESIAQTARWVRAELLKESHG